MTASYQYLFSDAYLRAVFDQEFRSFHKSAKELALIQRLEKWSTKSFQKETSAEGAFIGLFFEDTWGYIQSGKHHADTGFRAS